MSKVNVIEGNGFYKIKNTNTSPEIVLNYKTGNFAIKGVSLMADPVGFYTQVFNLIKKIISENKFKDLNVSFHFLYINTQSNKQIVGILSYFESLKIKTKLTWYYSDEEIAELGTHLRELIDIPLILEYRPEDKNYIDL